jgi:hypothetical protein
MSTTIGVDGTTSVPSGAFDAGMTTLSAEALLTYCQMQLNGLDGQINDQVTAQKTALRERQAVESVQTELTRFGTDGPQNPTDMKACVDAINNAISQLPSGDPVAGQLADFRDKMIAQYQYQPGPDETAAIASAQAQLQQEQGASLLGAADPQVLATQVTLAMLQSRQAGTLGKRPNTDAKEWQGTTDSLATIANDIKSNADIQLLTLQDLVSQRQQAVQLCSGMLSKTDQTLEDQAKAIGR